ncbi:hypothetical protein TNCV_1125011 [Trichonephila clavipes]|uniref:Uncharacterized protein n=1 Tax=Trichonephila clavipes TaxID=2585209 RepID=A0A8X6SGW9_TRICX|nr:hypothetical protein TNCV_1125011 [Trichonephila clavipes]
MAASSSSVNPAPLAHANDQGERHPREAPSQPEQAYDPDCLIPTVKHGKRSIWNTYPPPATLPELLQYLQEEWDNIHLKSIQRLY